VESNERSSSRENLIRDRDGVERDSSGDGARHVTDRLGCDVGHGGKLVADAKRCRTQGMGFNGATEARRARDIYREKATNRRTMIHDTITMEQRASIVNTNAGTCERHAGNETLYERSTRVVLTIGK